MQTQRHTNEAAMTILVTGGAGFLGAHLCRRLLDDGCTVICMDNFQTGARANIDPLADNPRFSVIEHDIADPLPQGLHPGQVYNLACPASPRHYQADPVHTVRTCVLGSLNLLELARRCGARILQASTSEIYGDPREHPQHERYHGNVNPVGLRACYDEGKRCAETLYSDYARTRGTETKIVRIFNTYGPGMAREDGRVISNFLTQALAGDALTVYGDGSQTRSLCYVDDLIEGLVRMMNSPAHFRGPVNLGNTEEISILEIARQICRLAGRQPAFRFLPLPADDPTLRRPDITLARRHLGWQPLVPFEEGLARTLSYFAQSAPPPGVHA